MTAALRTWTACYLLVFVGATAGCGGGPPQSNSPLEMSSKERFGELSELLSTAQIDLNRPPRSLEELKKYRLGGPFAFKAIADGDIIVLWGTALGQGTAIVAHEKTAPTAGGWVLLQDRTFKSMTADEFKSAPKAGS